jgi:hypothetical protein
MEENRIEESSSIFDDFLPDEDSGLLVEDEATPGEGDESKEKEGIDDPGGEPKPEPEEPEDTPEPKEEEEKPEEEPEPEPTPEPEEEEDDNPYSTTMQSFVEEGILTPLDEEKEYDASPEGMQELLNDTIQQRLEEAQKEQSANFRPEVQELQEFLEAYPEATVEDFLEEQQDFDYNEVDSSDPQNQIMLLQEYYSNQGYSRDEIIATLKEHQQAKSMGLHAKKAQGFLAAAQEQHIQAKKEAREQAQRQQYEQAQTQRMEFEQRILGTEKIGGLEIDPKDRKALAEYILKPVNEQGHSQLQLDENTDSDAGLLYAYLKYKGITLDKLTQTATKKATVKLRKKLNTGKDTLASGRGTTSPTRDAATGDLSGLDEWNM